MNKNRHRLVFDHRRAMRVPAAEHTCSSGKAGAGDGPAGSVRRSSGLVLQLGAFSLASLTGLVNGAWAAAPIPQAAALAGRVALPVRSTAAARTAGDWGRFNISQPTATELRVSQQSTRAIINWDSFDVGAGNKVRFEQPSQGSTLNKIWAADPTVVRGRIEANGEVILQNSNGVIFAPTARVETGRFVATALRVAEEAYKTGLRGITEGTPAFEALSAERNGYVSLEHGAEIRTAAGGDVLIFAPRVHNAGRIETPDGQTVLGAGQTVYLSASADPAQRGLLVGIKPFGRDEAGAAADLELNTVTQAAARSYKTVAGQTVADSTAANTDGLVEKVNAIVAERGGINLVALAIRQNGLLQATTAVKGLNGSIQLQAQADLQQRPALVAGTPVLVPQTTALGRVSMGPESLTQVLPAADSAATQLDSETFNRSRIRVEGERIHVEGGAVLRAPSGSIALLASDAPHRSLVFDPGSFDLAEHARDASRVVVSAGATLDVAGLKNVAIDGARNQMSGRLFQIELADAPVQRNGVLYREEVFFDARNPPSVANVAGFYNTVARTAAELSTTGGRLNIQADGGVAVDARALLDISGGSLQYSAADIKTSLVRQGTQWTGLDRADKAVRYDELGNSKARVDNNTATWRTQSVDAYVEGKNAGSATIAGRRTYFAGQVDARATAGPAQDGRTANVVVPQGGTLEFGRTRITDSALGSAALQAGPARSRPSALFDDALNASVDEQLQPTLVVSVNQLADAGLSGLQVHVANRLALTAGTQLQLAPGGSFQGNATAVDIAGSVVVPGGRIQLSTQGAANTARDITLGAQARLDTAGTWVVDSASTGATGSEGAAPLAVNGGSVVLTSAASLVAAPGARVDVSAGARRAGSTLTRGRAGSVVLAMNSEANISQPLPGTFDAWQGTLAGFDFARGGSLAISGLPSLTLGQAGVNANLNNGLFNGSGFGSISLSTLGDMQLAAGLNLQLQLQNFLEQNAVGSVNPNSRFASVGTQPVASTRAPVSLTLNAATAANRLAGVAGSALNMDSGARISTEAGGSLRLTARRQLTVDGTLAAPGGAITLTLAGQRGGGETAGVFDDNQGFDPTQSLWLGRTATLSVAGTNELSTDRLNRATGTVYGGGSITLNAERGYVVAQSGAVLDLRGHAATVLTASSPLPVRQSKSGGSLVISSPEGVQLQATMLAQAADEQADGGSLQLAVSLNGSERKTSGPAYGTTPREIVITQREAGLLSAAPAPGQGLQGALGNGKAELSNPLLQRAGFSQIDLKADDRIVFNDNLSLGAPRSLLLNTQALVGLADAEMALTSAYVALGDQRRSPRASFEVAPAASAGQATLRVDAGLIDLVGDLALQGTKLASLNATLDTAGGQNRRNGEVRLVGTTRGPSDDSASGSLRFAGELQFTAGQVVTSTMSSFSVEGLAGNSYLATYLPAGGSSSAAPLSALASLKLQADWIDLGGVLHLPFGRIEASADKLQVLEGALLSVSGDGLTVPVGTTVNGTQWQYRATGLLNSDGSAKPVNAATNRDIRLLDALPLEKAVVLNGKALALEPSARLSAAGGGVLQAWEFVAGVGGSSDTLLAPGTFAVLPGRNYEFAPFDPEVMAGAATTFRPGAQVHISTAGSALAPGRYTLLPARYALLPGAVLVSLAADQGKAALTTALNNDDGAAVVSGAFTGLASRSSDLAASRIRVEPAATVLARSRLDVTPIDKLLARNAERRDQPAPRLAGDAGRIALAATQAPRLDARLELGHSGGGKRGELDLAVRGGAMAIVDDAAAPPPGLALGTTLVSAANLARSEAGSVLVGGLRSTAADSLETNVAPLAATLSLLATATPLQAEEVLLLARDTLTLAAGTELRANAAVGTTAAATERTARHITLQGDAAHALVSPASDLRVTRRYPTGETPGLTGQLTVQNGASLAGTGIDLGATYALRLAPGAQLQTKNLGLAANRLALGLQSSTDERTTTVAGSVLAQLGTLDTLRLAALTGIDFHTPLSLTLDRLHIDTPVLRGAGGAAPAVRLQARDVVLNNTAAPASQAAELGTGTLEITATPGAQENTTGGLLLGSAAASSGVQTLGFDSALLASSGDIIFSGSGRVDAQRNLTLSAARVTAQTGAEQGAQALNGSLAIEKRSGASTRGEQVGQGAVLQFSAQQISQNGVVQARGGNLGFTATGLAAPSSSTSPPPAAMSFGAGSVTAAAGYSKTASEGFMVHGNAGRINASAAGAIELNGLLDVSAPGTADAGSISLSAPAHELRLGASAVLRGAGGSATTTAAAAPRQGRFTADAALLAGPQAPTSAGAALPIDPWAQALDTGGFHDSVALRQRSGSLVLEQATLRAGRVDLAADQGAITLNGNIDARSAAGGSVRVFAHNTLTLNGSVAAASSRAGANGGDVTLGSTQGQVVLGAAARIDASGDNTADGRIVLRAARDDSAGTVAVAAAPAFNSTQQLQAGGVVVEAVRSYTGFDRLVAGAGAGSALGQDQVVDDQQQFLLAAAAGTNSGLLASATPLAQDPRVSLRGGAQVLAAGDFTVPQDWNLADAQSPGFLTLRAAGHLRLAGSISDGFELATRPAADRLTTPTALIEGPAWSLRLVAGADTAAADPLATRSGAAADLTLANNVLVRTTAGSIDLAAARDIALGTGGNAASQQAVVYVAGRPSEQLQGLLLAGSSWEAQFTSQGGGVTLTAGRDIVGQAARQLSGAWFFHTGVPDQTAVAWWSAFDSFRQGVGSFGGGNLRVQAGRHVVDLGLAAPSTGLAAEALVTGEPVQSPGTVPRTENGGDIVLDAGGDIRGGTYFLGRGTGRLTAAGAIDSSPGFSAAMPRTGPLLALMDGVWSLAARGKAEVAGVVNPTMLPQSNRESGVAQRISDLDAGDFFTYAGHSAVQVSSQAGAVLWLPDRLPNTDGSAAAPSMSSYWINLAGNGPALEQMAWSNRYALATAWLPPSVQMNALGGDLTLALPAFTSGLTLFPAAGGQLSLHAQGRLAFSAGANTLGLAMSDQRPDTLPSPLQPVSVASTDSVAFNSETLRTPIHTADVRFDGIHAGDPQPVRLHAGGDINFNQGNRTAAVVLVLPKAASLTAGGDIRGLSLISQHNRSDELTSLNAGGSIVQGADTGTRIVLAGPGTLALNAGRQLDLGASQGVETVGNTYRSSLPAQGADLVLAAGTRATLDVDGFVQRYLTPAAAGAASSSGAQAQAQAAADAYLSATGRDPAALDSAGQALRAQLVQRYASLSRLWGGSDAAAVQERRLQLVAAVRQHLALPTLPSAEAAAGFDAALAQFQGLSRGTQTRMAEQLLNGLFVQTYIAAGQPYAERWQAAAAAAGADPAVTSGITFDRLRRDILFAELAAAGNLASVVPASANSTRRQAYDSGFLAADLAGLGSSFAFAGDLDMVASGVQAARGGRITLLAPGGQINVGLPGTGAAGGQGLKGAVGYGESGIQAFSAGDFQVNSQRVFVVGQGDVTIWSSRGNIDAGRGANTNISVPPLVAVRSADGSIGFTLPSLAVGSGIGILQPAVGQAQGDIGLYAPNGEVRALDAQIRAPGRITLAADVVRGADNISGGTVVGAPVVVPAVPFALPSAAPSAGETQAASGATGNSAAAQARERNSLLLVELLGLGLAVEDENCSAGTAEEKAACEKRKKPRAAAPRS